jgi:hypothetical protein
MADLFTTDAVFEMPYLPPGAPVLRTLRFC